jgi:hypothetical protein
MRNEMAGSSQEGGLPGGFEDAGDIFENVDPFLVTFGSKYGGQQLQTISGGI